MYILWSKEEYLVSRTPACTWQLEAFTGKYTTATLPDVVLVLLLPTHCLLYILCHLDRMRCTHFSYRQAGMAHRSQWNYLRPCILSVFQRHSSKARSTDCYLLISYFSLWWTYLEYVPILCKRNHFLGRTP